MGYSNALGIEYRVVKEAEYQGKAVRIVIGARTYETEVEDLWDAITNAERISCWFGPVGGELKLGGRYQLEGNASGEITRCDPPTAFDLTWEFGNNVSWVSVQLETVTDGTRLTLEHIMEKDEASEAHWRTYGPGATGVGWELGFLGLGMYLDRGGEAVAEEEFNDWMASPEGKAFLKRCANAWSEAHIESGEDTAIAAAMAEETASFYCGGHTH